MQRGTPQPQDRRGAATPAPGSAPIGQLAHAARLVQRGAIDFTAASRCPPRDVAVQLDPFRAAGAPPATSPATDGLDGNAADASCGRSSTSDLGEPLLLTKQAAAQRLCVSVRQLSRFIATGELVPVRLGPRLVRFTPNALAQFIERRTHRAPRVAWPQVPQIRTR